MTLEIIPAIDAIVAERPKSVAFMRKGRWSHVIAGWRAQCDLNKARVADEMKSCRLGMAEGQSLRELAASEYNMTMSLEPQNALGYVVLERSTGIYAKGTIRKGHLFARRSDPEASPLPVESAQYEALSSVVVRDGDTSVVVPIVARQPGTAANIVQGVGSTDGSIISLQPFFDTAFSVTESWAAGGSSDLPDGVVRRAAQENFFGQYGATKGAIVAELLKQQNVRHAAYFEDTTKGSALVYVADASWASSEVWADSLRETVTDVLGVGCRFDLGLVRNKFVRVDATIRLKETRYLSDTTEIEKDIRTAIRSYFEERPDWYTFRLGTLRSIIARAHRRSQVCTTVAVKDHTTETDLTEPAATGSTSAGALIHYYVPEDSIRLEFLPPT